MDELDITFDGVVFEAVYPTFLYSHPEPAPTILGALPAGHLSHLSIGVQVHLVARVPIAHPYRRNSGDDVIVVHPASIIEFDVMDVATGSNPWTAVGIQRARIGSNMREPTATGADRGHRPTKRMAAEPERFAVIDKHLFKQRP